MESRAAQRALCAALAAAAIAAGLLANPRQAPAAPAPDRIPPYLLVWMAKYPTSTLPARMAALTGSACFVCHQPPSTGLDGNCYRNHLRELIDAGYTIEDAIDAIDGLDSDGDGVPNGREITEPRRDQPGEVGYNPGLAGPLGEDFCSKDPPGSGSGQLETPPLPLSCSANCDHSTGAPILTAADFLCFAAAFAAGDLRANCDAQPTPPALNVLDFMCYVNRFAAGCP